MTEPPRPIPEHCAAVIHGGEKVVGPGATAFTLYDERSLEVSRGATPEAFEAALAAGFFDRVERIDVLKTSSLTRLPDGVRRLTAVVWLRISTAAFAGWETVYNIPSLASLVLDGAASGALPRGLAALKALTLLDARAKGITALPPDLAELPSLAHVRVRPALREELRRLTPAASSPALLPAHHGLSSDGQSDAAAPARDAGALLAHHAELDAVEVRRALTRFEAWLSVHLPDYLAKLQPGLDPAAVDEVDSELGAPLPPAVRALYAWRNGDPSGDGPLTFLRHFLPLGDALRQRRMLLAMHRAAEWGKGLPGAWSESWFPLASWANGFRLCVDLRGTFKGKRGQVLEVWMKDTDRAIVAPSLGVWWRAHVDALHAGEITCGDGGDWSWPYPRTTPGLPGYPIKRSAKEKP